MRVGIGKVYGDGVLCVCVGGVSMRDGRGDRGEFT